MWDRITDRLSCPFCKKGLELAAFRSSHDQVSPEYLGLAAGRGISEEALRKWIEAGLLLCGSCAIWFPVWHGLPILLPYATKTHGEFSTEFKNELADFQPKYEPAAQEPDPGEKFVLSSFSKEWLDYDFDGVIWTASYVDQEQTFLREVAYSPDDFGLSYLEVGCGIGITASIAQKVLAADAIGIDLSLAALKATQHWRHNPFMHFVQASAFHLPVRDGSFDVVYSRGALHHTFSTEKAFKYVAACCRPGGKTYLWVYGNASIRQNLFRSVAFAFESAIRPMLSRHADSKFATVILAGLSCGYLVFNKTRRLRNPEMQSYNFRRALHAARDRFTPQYAHRHDPQEVMRWFGQAGFDSIELVDWRTMPLAERENFERNVGVRGRKS